MRIVNVCFAILLLSYAVQTSRDDLDSFLNDRMQQQMGKEDPSALELLRRDFKRTMVAARPSACKEVWSLVNKDPIFVSCWTNPKVF